MYFTRLMYWISVYKDVRKITANLTAFCCSKISANLTVLRCHKIAANLTFFRCSKIAANLTVFAAVKLLPTLPFFELGNCSISAIDERYNCNRNFYTVKK